MVWYGMIMEIQIATSTNILLVDPGGGDTIYDGTK
jgi:hypothetical protein